MFKYLCVSQVLKFVVKILNAITMFKTFWLGLLKCVIFSFIYITLLVKLSEVSNGIRFYISKRFKTLNNIKLYFVTFFSIQKIFFRLLT